MVATKNIKKPSQKAKTRKQTSSFYSFSPKINLLLLSLFAIGTFITVAAVQQRQDIRQNASPNNGGVVPSFVCGGSGQGICPSNVPSTAPNNNAPGQVEPDPGGNQEQDQPGNTAPGQPGQIEPGQPEENNGGGGNGGNGGNNGGGNTGGVEGLLNRIIEMLNQIMQMLQQLLGGGGNPGTPNPGNPNPGNPNPGNPQPSQGNPGNPQPSQANPGNPNPGNPQPSTAAPSTTAPSTAPSAAAGDTIAPNAPTSLKATAAAGGKINLTWTAATDNAGGSGIKEYEVYRSEGDARSPGGNTGINFNKKVGTATKFTDTGRKAGTTYYYYVRAFDKAGNRGAHSNTAGATGKK